MYASALDAAETAGWPEAAAAMAAAEAAPLVDVEAGRRPFATPEDLARASRALSLADALLNLGAEAGLLHPEEAETKATPAEAPLSVRLLTAGLAEAGGRPRGAPQPLDAGTLRRGLEAALDESGRVRPEFRARLLDRLSERRGVAEAAAATLVERALFRLEDEAGPAWAAGEFDPTLAEFVLRRLGPDAAD